MRSPNRLLVFLLSTCVLTFLAQGLSKLSFASESLSKTAAQKPKPVPKGTTPSGPSGSSVKPPAKDDASSTAKVELPYLSGFERQIFAEINLARTNPKLYATYLEDYKKLYIDNRLFLPKRLPLITFEGLKPVDELLGILRSMSALPSYAPSEGMSLAAKERLDDMVKTGLKGHRGSDGSLPNDRLDKYGKWGKSVGEAIAYDVGTAREVVMSLLVDDGTKDRGHRKNLLSKDYTVVGLASGESLKANSSCIIDFAGSFKNKTSSAEPSPVTPSKSGKTR